jgi:heme exporter protein A
LANEPAAILVRDLRVRFGDVPALRGVSFEVAEGERTAIFGPNGAGKTTLLRVLAGAVRPAAGSLRLAGFDPSRDGAPARAKLGVLSHHTYLYGELTARENLRLYGQLYGVESIGERVDALLERVGLYGRRNDRVGALSRGMQQRLAIARAVLHRPEILLLDEPETGLDLSAHQLLESVLFEDDSRRTVLIATHDLDQGRRACQTAMVLVSGRLVDRLSAAELDTERLGRLYRAPLPAFSEPRP